MIAQVYAGVPPLAPSVPLYGWLTVAPGRVPELIANVDVVVTTARGKVVVAVCVAGLESFTIRPTGNVPVAVGVPEIMPPAEMARPVGGWPAQL